MKEEERGKMKGRGVQVEGRRWKVGIFSFLLRSNGEGGSRERKVQAGGRY